MNDSIKDPTPTHETIKVEFSATIPSWFAHNVFAHGNKALSKWLEDNAPPHIQRLASRMADLNYFIGSAEADGFMNINAVDAVAAVVNSMSEWNDKKCAWRNPEAK